MSIFSLTSFKYSISILFLIIAILVGFFTYKHNINREIEFLKEREIKLFQKELIRTQVILNILLRKKEFDEIKREISMFYSTLNIEKVFLIDENFKVVEAYNKDFLNKNIEELVIKDIVEILNSVQKTNINRVFIDEKEGLLYAISAINFGSLKGTFEIGKIGTLLVVKDIKPQIKELLYYEELEVIVPISIYMISIFIIGLLIYFYFIKRIKQIAVTIKQISDGDIYARVHLKGKDEISMLAMKVDLMADKLKDSIKLLDQYKRVVDESSIISKSDTKGVITYVNDELCDTMGYSRDELIGKPHNIFRHPTTSKEVFRDMWLKIQNKQIWKGILKNRKKDGSSFYANVTIVPILGSNGEIKEYIALRQDVTELMENRVELKQVFHTDPLTSLGSRTKLINDLEKIEMPAIALVNIDGFHELNDFYGYRVGDFILVEFANRLFDFFGKKFKIYRLYGDEFAILSNIKFISKESFIDYIHEFLKRHQLNDFEFEDKKIKFNITIGASFESENLLINADITLKTAKNQKMDFLIYDESIKTSKDYKNNVEWANSIRKAIDEDRIVPYFQAIFNNESEKIEKYECLVRMISEDNRVISPYFFLDISKKIKLYHKITKIMIEKSFEKFKNNNFEFSINLSVEDILNREIVEFLEEKIKEYSVKGRVVFELVESDGIENYEEVTKFIENAKKCGCKIAIDDFGTGYSNFEYLIKLNADYIKIDGSMIKNIDKDKSSQEVVETIVNFAKKRNLKTIAEFVSTKEVFEKVKELNIDYSQGYFINEPKEDI